RIRDQETKLADLQKGHRMLKEEVDEEDIAEVVSRWTHIPVSRLMEGEVQKLLQMEERLHKRVIGQDEAITAVSHAIRRACAGLTAARTMEEAAIDERTRRHVMDALREHFRPEFLNRIDEIIFFHALGREHMKRIIDIQIAGLTRRLEERKIHVMLTDAAKD